MTEREVTYPRIEKEFPEKWAFMVGVDAYPYIEKLKWCSRDVEELSKTFQNDLEFKPKNIFEFREGGEFPPDAGVIWHKIGDLRKSGQVERDHLLVFYFSGHGMIETTEEKDYLLPLTATEYNLRNSAMPLDDLVRELKGFECDNVVLILDACRSRANGTKGPESGFGQKMKLVSLSEGIVSFFSCQPKGKSFEIDKLKHGSFTYSLIEAIRAGNETVAELDKFLQKQVQSVNDENGKGLQLPWTKTEPTSLAGLAIFPNPGKRRAREAEVDKVEEGLMALYLESKIGDLAYRGAMDVLGHVRSGAIAHEHRIVDLIKKLHSSPDTEEEFTRFLAVFENSQSRRQPVYEIRKPPVSEQ